MPSSAIPLSFSEVKVKKEVAADASKKNATEDAAVFDFWTAPSPPRNHPQTMQWSHREFQQKRISGKFVLTRQVRETWNECMGFYPTFDAPELLDRTQFEKFNYYAYLREEDQLCDLPEGTVPIDYVDNPEAWFQRQRLVDVMAFRSTDKSTSKVRKVKGPGTPPKKKKKKKTKGNTTPEVQVVKSYCSPLSTMEVDPSSLTLTAMEDCVKRNIADFLSVAVWQERLRFLDKSCVNWPKSPPCFEYKTIVFQISDAFSEGVVGLAKTVDDMETAALTMFEELSKRNTGEMKLQYFFIDFEVLSPLLKERSLPIATFKDFEYWEHWEDCVFGHELAQKFLGVKVVHQGTSALYSNAWSCSQDWNERHGNPQVIVGRNLGLLKAWIGESKFCPSVDLDLSQFHLTAYEDPEEGDSRMDIWFCSKSFAPEDKAKDTSENGSKKTWVLFDQNSITLWDT